jgi:flagellar biosynthesis protein
VKPYDKGLSRAVALQYGEYKVPKVVAKGDGEMAQAIIEAAISQGTVITENPALAALLTEVELNTEIPEELYVAVAVVLSWVYWMRGDTPDQHKS